MAGQGAFQELDAVSLLAPHAKLAIRPPSLDALPDVLEHAYRRALYGRPGAAFVDLPADLIRATVRSLPDALPPVPAAPLSGAAEARVLAAARALKAARAPLVVVGKGAAYARAEGAIRRLLEQTRVPVLPTPMGKGVVDDGHPLNVAAARSTALQHADVVLLLGARLNWILHFGAPPKWSPDAVFIQVDIEPAEVGRNAGSAELGLVGDVGVVAEQLAGALAGWTYAPATPTPYLLELQHAGKRNETKAQALAARETPHGQPLTFQRAFEIIRSEIATVAPVEEGGVVYVAEGANTMDISRSAFPVAKPRLRLDAGTYATMGVGMGYAIAAHAAYNSPQASVATGQKPKKVVCLEGDSAFGFSGLEVETMARQGIDVLIFVMNNGGVYRGDADTQKAWTEMQERGGLRSTSLGYEVRYEKLAEMCGGKGWFVKSEEELRKAVKEGFEASTVGVVNVCIESGKDTVLQFGWQASQGKNEKQAEPKL